LRKQAKNKMENFRIESLEINKIGAFEHIKMDFPKKTDPDKAEIHILTGENGTGKSTVLEALAEIGKTQISDIEQNSFRNKFHDFDANINVKINPIEFSTELLYDDFYSPTLPKFLIGRDIQSKIDTRYGVTFAMFAYSGYRRLVSSKVVSIDKIRHDFPEALLDSLDFEKSINTEKLVQWIGTAKAQEALSLVAGKKDRAEQFRDSVETIEKIIEGITNEKIKFDLNSESMHLNIIMGDKRLALMGLPDGLKSMISWIGDFVMRMNQIAWVHYIPLFDRNFILFLDEIEVHLHPAWQRKILPVVQKLFKNAQIFISTHSPFVVGSVDGAWVHKLKKEGAYAVLDGEPVLSEDAESYDTILEEIFGIKERFGVRVEEDLKQFYQFKSKILNDEDYDMDTFLNLVSKLASESIELESMLGMELKQIKRLTGKDFLATV
jgi:predicted ATP-binding protein involved in virulence